MRIEAVRITNFRGLRHAEVDELASSSLVTVSGPNGAGKSLLFEALTVHWRAAAPWPPTLDLNGLVGPWGDTSDIEISFALTDSERADLLTYRRQREQLEDGIIAPALIHTVTRITKDNKWGRLERNVEDDWGALFWSMDFAEHYPFAHLDYLPADRGIQRGEQAQVNPSMLSAQQVEGLRQQVFNSFISQRQLLTLGGVQPFLASLDYLDMLADREGKPPSGDFEAITDPFELATGKKINRPRIDPASAFGAAIEVTTRSGAKHGIDQLSSGEQEVLALMFYIRRLRASGGLLLVDEPELHLHPSLQQSLFSVMENVAERAQVWIVTHAAKLVTAAPLNAILHMSPTDGTDRNQLAKASDEERRGRLLSDLGVHPIDVLQNDSLVVVEGSDDAIRLPAALSLVLSRSAIYIAGNAEGVESTARTLRSGRTLIPWIAIRDRDLLSDADVHERITRLPGLFIWPHRTLENEFLHPPLLVRTLERAGREANEDVVRTTLRALADLQKEGIIADLIEAELVRLYPYEIATGVASLIDRKLDFLNAQAASTASKLANFQSVALRIRQEAERRWDDDWFTLMDGKRAIGEYVRHTPYRTQGDLISAVTHTLRDEPSFLPPGMATLRDQIDSSR